MFCLHLMGKQSKAQRAGSRELVAGWGQARGSAPDFPVCALPERFCLCCGRVGFRQGSSFVSSYPHRGEEGQGVAPRYH